MNAQVIKTINRYKMIGKNDTVVCGVSGGADSMAMISIFLKIQKEYNLKLVVCHINHLLRGEESDRDQEFVREFCKKNCIDFFVKRADIKKGAKKSGLTVEEYGREIRYSFFKKIAGSIENKSKNPVKIATAHNLSDVTETMIFHMVRGTGIRGLRAIAPKDENILEPFVVIRPVIECDRFLIENYLKDNNIENVFDSSNQSDDYTRNLLRSQVLPVFNSININYGRNFFSLRQQADEVNDYLSIEAIELLKLARVDTYGENILEVLDGEVLKKSHRAILSTLVMFFLERNNIEVSEKKVKSVIEIIKKDGKVNLSKNIFLKKDKSLIFLYKEDKASDPPYYFPASLGENKVKMNKTIELKELKRTSYENFNINNLNMLKNMLDYDIIKGRKLVLRSREEKDSIKLFSRGVTKSLKKLYNEEKILVDRRNHLAVFTVDGEVAWVEGFGVSEKYALKSITKNILEINTINS